MQGIYFYNMLYILFVNEPNKVCVAVSKTKLFWFPRRLDSTCINYGEPFGKKMYDKSRAKKKDNFLFSNPTVRNLA